MHTRTSPDARRWVAAFALASLGACSSLPMNGLMASKPAGLESLSKKIGPDGADLRFDFEFDDKADAAEGEVGSGYIVVSRDGKELQALPHAFEMPKDQLDPRGWLDFKDFNGDGLLDFKVTRLYTLGGKLAVDSLYQFDAKTGTFGQVDAVSNAGEIAVSASGCVSLKVPNAAGAVKLESHCFFPASAKWVRGKPDANQKGLAVKTEAVCDPMAPELTVCRKARIEQDRTLLKVVREYRLSRQQALQSTQGKGYAEAYARTQDLDHQSWQRHRDARCAAQAREQAVPVKTLPAATELCRYDWARDQLRRYQDQIAHQGGAKDKP